MNDIENAFCSRVRTVSQECETLRSTICTQRQIKNKKQPMPKALMGILHKKRPLGPACPICAANIKQDRANSAECAMQDR